MPSWPIVFTDGFVEVNGVNLSDHETQAEVNVMSGTVDTSAMGATYRTRKPTLKDWEMTLTFQQDYAASKVHKTIMPLVGTSACVEIRPQNACTTVINPSFYGVGIVERYTPLGGGFEDVLATQVTIRGSGAFSSASSS